MTRDIETLRFWIRVCLTIAAICCTAVPAIYAFSPWYKSMLGRAFMLQGISFALIVDVTLLFSYWKTLDPDAILVRFYLDAAMLTFVAGATMWLTLIIWQLNHRDDAQSQEEDSYDQRHSH